MLDEVKKWVKISLCTQPEGWQAWIDPGGVSSVFVSYFFFGMQVTEEVGLMQVTTVTRDPHLVD